MAIPAMPAPIMTILSPAEATSEDEPMLLTSRHRYANSTMLGGGILRALWCVMAFDF